MMCLHFLMVEPLAATHRDAHELDHRYRKTVWNTGKRLKVAKPEGRSMIESVSAPAE